MKHIDIKEVFADKALVNTKVTVCGWVRTARIRLSRSAAG